MIPISIILLLAFFTPVTRGSLIKEDNHPKISFSIPDTDFENIIIQTHITDNYSSMFPWLSKRLVDEPNVATPDDISDFHMKLRLFITPDGFEIFNFDRHVNEFRTGLAAIEFHAENNPNYDDTEVKRVKIMKAMLYTMMDSCGRMKRYFSSNLPGHDFVYRMIELNLRAWSLNDSHGNLDSRIDSGMEKVQTLQAEFYTLAEDFANIRDIRFSKRSFWVEAMRTIKTIDRLKMEDKIEKRGRRARAFLVNHAMDQFEI